jgi:uncharacterized protein YukE
MTCRELATLIDELVDGTLDARRASAVRGHARGCAACAKRLDETAALAEGLRGLEPMDPPASLWGRIEAGLAQEEQKDAERPRLWWWWQAARPTVAWAAAGAMVVGLAVGAVWIRKRRGGAHETAAAHASAEAARVAPAPIAPAPAVADDSAPPSFDEAVADLGRAEAEYRKAVDELHGVVDRERPRWKAEVAKAYDANLAVIDQAVEAQRQAFRDHPGDVAQLDGLEAAYRKKIDFMEEAVVRGGQP